MLELEMENRRVERLRVQKFGEDWIQAIMAGTLGRLEKLCHPEIVTRLLTPKRLLTLDNAADLVARYHQWFGECLNFHLERSRVEPVGERLGIFYRFLLQRQRDWYTVEQQLYCTLKDGRVAQLQLLSSGFQPVEAQAGEQDPARDQLLEFQTGTAETGSTCAVLTPAIKSKLREMQTGQVLEVRVDDPSARGDVEAWSRLSGNLLLKVIDEGQELRFFVQKK